MSEAIVPCDMELCSSLLNATVKIVQICQHANVIVNVKVARFMVHCTGYIEYVLFVHVRKYYTWLPRTNSTHHNLSTFAQVKSHGLEITTVEP